MKYATTQELIALNDEAVLNDFNEWLSAPFFHEVDRDGLDVLAHAIPHGLRPGSHVTEPPHHRTLWYAQISDGTSRPVKLDVTNISLDALPEVPGTPDARPVVSALPPVVMLDDHWLIDGKHFVEAAKLGDVEEVEALTLRSYSDDELRARRDLR